MLPECGLCGRWSRTPRIDVVVSDMFSYGSRVLLDHLSIDEGEKWGLTHGEGVEVGLTDEELRISSRAGNRFDCVTNRTGDAGLRRRIIDIVVCGVIESPAKERHRIVTASAESGRMNVSISGE